MTVKGCGELLVYCSQSPTTVTAEGRVGYAYTAESKTATVHLGEEGGMVRHVCVEFL